MTGPLAVAVPWRPGNPWREKLCEYTVDYLKRTLPGVPVEFFDTEDELFSRSASCNKAMRFFADYRAVLLCDADMLPDPAVVWEAASQAPQDGGMHIPFSRYFRLEPEPTHRILAGCDPWMEKHSVAPWDFPVGAMTLMSPEAWWGLGGMDERFGAWGYHDTAFHYAALTLSRVVRHDGEALHLWHEEGGPDEERYRHQADIQRTNEELCAEYEKAQNDPERMRAVIGLNPRSEA